MVLQLQAAVEGALHDGHLPFVHEAHYIVGVVHLVDVLSFVDWAPPVDGNLLLGGVLPRGREEEGTGEAEAVAVVRTDDATVGRSFLADNEVGAGLGLQAEGHKDQEYQG